MNDKNNKYKLILNAIFSFSLVCAMVMVPLVSSAPDSLTCKDYKGDNAGFGGDKYTECDAHPKDGMAVNFVCGGKSGNAILVVANDPDADAKGKLSCGGELVAKCYGLVQCEAIGTYTSGGAIQKVEGSCLGGTEEKADSGMAWSCDSVGAGACPDPESCDVVGAAEEALETVRDLLCQEQCGQLNPDILSKFNVGDRIAQFELGIKTDEYVSVVVGIVDSLGNTFGAVCISDCVITPVNCEIVGGGHFCDVALPSLPKLNSDIPEFW